VVDDPGESLLREELIEERLDASHADIALPKEKLVKIRRAKHDSAR
jgi:hypothetical protein